MQFSLEDNLLIHSYFLRYYEYEVCMDKNSIVNNLKEAGIREVCCEDIANIFATLYNQLNSQITLLKREISMLKYKETPF